MLSKSRPELFVATMRKDRRPGKVFVDAMRNATELRVMAAAYSARMHPGAPVSVPLAWDELGERDVRQAHTVKSFPARLARRAADPWKAYWTTRQAITDTMRAAVAAA